jgi:hypothetical protein
MRKKENFSDGIAMWPLLPQELHYKVALECKTILSILQTGLPQKTSIEIKGSPIQ